MRIFKKQVFPYRRHREFLCWAFLFLLFTQTSCQKTEKNPVIILAFDRLSMTDVSCIATTNRGQLTAIDQLCQESVRFTHAYTTSTLTNPAIASILTAQYPFQHKSRHNGSPPLAPEIQTVAETAVRKSYRTSFFSGGAPVLRKSGLGQGFEVFDDRFIPSLDKIYRPMEQTIAAFQQWLDSEGISDSFFSFLYFPDLNFTQNAVDNNMESHQQNLDLKNESFNRSLIQFFQYLKKRDIWNKAYIMLVGLNGSASFYHQNEMKPLNLHSENTQVAMLIKPPHKIRDIGIQWNMDENVSLVDLGKTLFEIVGEQPQSKSENFQSISFMKAFQHPNGLLPDGRFLVVESAWSQWRGVGGIRAALVKDYELYFFDQRPTYFNMLTDRTETNKIYRRMPNYEEILRQNNFSSWQMPENLQSQYPHVISYYWNQPQQNNLLIKELKALVEKEKYQTVATEWLAEFYLDQQKWHDLQWLANKTKNSVWLFVAQKNLGEKNVAIPKNFCLEIIYKKNPTQEEIKGCADPLFQELFDWIRYDIRGLTKNLQRQRFEKAYRSYLIEKKILKNQIVNSFIYDINPTKKYAPSMVDLVLSLPEFSKIKWNFTRRLMENTEPEEEF